MNGKLIALVMFLFCTFWCKGHGDLHERIRLLTVQIQKFPHDKDLFFEWGALYLQHESYRKAIRDLRHCVKSPENNQRCYYLLAQARFRMGQYQKCVRQLLKMTKNQEGAGNIYYLLSRSYENLGDLHAAAYWLQKYFKQSVFKRPDHYLALARISWLQLEYNQEIHWLETAVNRFGYLPSLVQQLLSAYKNAKYFDAAIKLQSDLLENQQRKEFALFERAQLFHWSGDDLAATRDLLQIGSEIEKLPKHIRAQKSIVELAEKVNLLLVKIEKSTS